MEFREFIEARLAEDEWWARNAGGCFDNTPPETGEHWRWVESRGDTPVTPDPTIGEHLDDGGAGEWRSLALRSVEHYPIAGASYRLPSFIISTAEEVNTVGAGHIARHDPARVLRDVEAKRRLLAQHQAVCDEVRSPKSAEHRMNARARQFALDEVLATLALPYSDHPDYDPSWLPEATA